MDHQWLCAVCVDKAFHGCQHPQCPSRTAVPTAAIGGPAGDFSPTAPSLSRRGDSQPTAASLRPAAPDLQSDNAPAGSRRGQP